MRYFYISFLLCYLVISFFISYSLSGSEVLERERYQNSFVSLRSFMEKDFEGLEKHLREKKTSQNKNFFLSVSRLLAILKYEKKGVSYKKLYKYFLKNYRNCLESKFYRKLSLLKIRDKAVLFLEKIGFSLFAKNNLSKYHRNLMSFVSKKSGIIFNTSLFDKEDFLDEDQDKIKKLEAIILETNLVQNAIGEARGFFNKSSFTRFKDSYRGLTVWSKFDPHMEGGLPNYKYGVLDKENKETHFLRLSTPTLGKNKKPRLAPEFRAFLHYLKRHKLKHTYISMQDRRSFGLRTANKKREYLKAFGVDCETHRARLLESLNHDPSLKGVLEVVTLSKDSLFYLQKGEFSGKEEKRKFFSDYVFFLKNNGEGYYFPLSWKSKKINLLISRFDKLLKTLFPHKNILTRKDKRLFIELSYLVVVDFVQEDSFSVNITCKQGIDRAGCSYALLYLITFLLNDTESFRGRTSLEGFLSVLFNDVLSMRKREVSPGRFKVFYETLETFLSFLKEKPELIKAFSEIFSFREIKLPLSGKAL